MAKSSIINSVNAIREVSSANYKSVVPILTVSSGIETLSAPLLQYPNLMNEFINVLVQKISYSQLVTKMYNNPLQFLEGDNIPLGTIGEEIYINPAER